MPTVQFQEILQALRDRDERRTGCWRSPAPAERRDGLESEAYVAAHLSSLIRCEPNQDDLLVKLMERQEKRLKNRIDEATECGIVDYASSRSFHNHVNLTIDAVLHPENYADDTEFWLRDSDFQFSVRFNMKALGMDLPNQGRQAGRDGLQAPSQRRQAGRGRNGGDGPGWEC